MNPSGSRKPATDDVPEMLTSAEYFRRKWTGKLIFWSLIVALLTGLGIWLGPRTIESLKTWRGRKLVEFARVQKESGNKLEMKNLLLQAYGLAPKDDVVLRAMADDYAESLPEMLRFLQQIVAGTTATKEDRLKLCKVALDNRVTSVVEREFQALLSDPASKDDPVAAELCARYLSLQGDRGKALEWTGIATPAVKGDETSASPSELKAQVVPGSNAKLSIIRAKLLLDSIPAEEEKRKQVGADTAALLWAAINNGAEAEQREAAALLGRLYVTVSQVRDTFDEKQTTTLLAKLDQWSGDVRWDARLVAADLRIFLKPDTKGQVIDDLVKAATDSKEQATQLELARWLNVRDESRRAQAMAEANASSDRSREWLLIQLDAMAAEKKWAEIETILLNPNGVAIEEALGRLFLWRCGRELGRPPAELEELRNKAVDAAKESPPEVDFFIAGYLERLGERAAAAGVYARRTEDEALAGPSYLGLVRCVSADPGRTSELKDILQKMLAKYPHIREARNDLAYLNLLDGSNLNESTHYAKMLMNEAPEVLAYRTTMALAELVQGNFKEAEEFYRNVDIDWKKVQPGWTAVRAAVAGANGKTDEARKLIEIVDVASLRSGEKKLLEKYVGN